MAALSHQRQGDHSYHTGQHRQHSVHSGMTRKGYHIQSEFYSGMTPMSLWCWLISRGVSRNEIDKKPTMFLLDQYKWNSQTNDKLH